MIHDTNMNGHPLPGDGKPGPWEAVEEFLKTDDRFQRNHNRESFLITLMPSGFLKLVK